MEKSYKVYGMNGHRQAESFAPSFTVKTDRATVGLKNSDKTGTNDYAIITITADTEEEIEEELSAQLSDGAFENYRIGIVKEITKEYTVEHSHWIDGSGISYTEPIDTITDYTADTAAEYSEYCTPGDYITITDNETGEKVAEYREPFTD